MNNLREKIKQVALLCGDLVLLYLALAATLALRYGRQFFAENWNDHAVPFTIVFAMWVVIFYIQGLYDLERAKTNIAFFRTFAESLAVATALAVALFYLMPAFGIAPRTNLALVLIAVFALLSAWRIAWNAFLATRKRMRVLFLGEGAETDELIKKLQDEPQLGYEVAGVLSPTDALPDEIFLPGRADLIVFTPALLALPHASRKLYGALVSQAQLVDLVSFYEDVQKRIPLSELSEAWFLQNLRDAGKRLTDISKRALDGALGIALALLLLAVTPLVAFAVWVDDRGPLTYTQRRIGKNGRPFSIVKFRTMKRDAEGDGAQFAMPRDPRVTRVGHFLRRTRIDELPQVWNVLRGDMSFVGPRPERPEFVTELTQAMSFYPVRHLVKPGLTGWAQINFPYANSLETNLKKLQYDLYYLKHRSLLLDLTILLRTLKVVLRGGGS
jgi:exopolysaccharide biosynthesis polyprenyl glycosylphosphotransferase